MNNITICADTIIMLQNHPLFQIKRSTVYMCVNKELTHYAIGCIGLCRKKILIIVKMFIIVNLLLISCDGITLHHSCDLTGRIHTNRQSCSYREKKQIPCIAFTIVIPQIKTFCCRNILVVA